MDFKENLENFRKNLDREIETFFDRTIAEARGKDGFIAESLEIVRDNILSGGKRIRPALMYWGYIGAGGEEREKMLKTSLSMELIHSFLLIHDDVMDRDSMRHGRDTLNRAYEKIGKKLFQASDSEHFGNSIAITVGDMVAALGNRIIFEAPFSPEIIMKALAKLQDIVSLTVIGQAKDIYMEYQREATEKEVLEMYEYKTARYTLEGPLQLGGILGGAPEKVLESFSRIALPLGIAFQIQDDILGMFGEEEEIGKPVGSDIREGKQTLLAVKALELSDSKEKEKLLLLLGNSQIGVEDIEEFRRIILSSGSLDYAREMAGKLIQEGKGEIGKSEIAEETKEFLRGMADYMIERKY